LKLQENSSLASFLKNRPYSLREHTRLKSHTILRLASFRVPQNIGLILHAITLHRYASEISYWVRSVNQLLGSFRKTLFVHRLHPGFCPVVSNTQLKNDKTGNKNTVRRMSKRNVCAILCDVVRSCAISLSVAPASCANSAAMDSLITAAARALAVGDPLAALKRIALREDAPALALRGIAMAQLGDLARAKELLRRAARAFGPKEPMARARCVVAEAEIALVSRDSAGARRRSTRRGDTRSALVTGQTPRMPDISMSGGYS